MDLIFYASQISVKNLYSCTDIMREQIVQYSVAMAKEWIILLLFIISFELKTVTRGRRMHNIK